MCWPHRRPWARAWGRGVPPAAGPWQAARAQRVTLCRSSGTQWGVVGPETSRGPLSPRPAGRARSSPVGVGLCGGRRCAASRGLFRPGLGAVERAEVRFRVLVVAHRLHQELLLGRTHRGRRPRAGRGWRGPGRWSGRRPRPPRSCCRDPLSGRPGVLDRPGPPPESTHVSVFTPKPCGCLRSAGMPRGLNRSTSMCMDSGGCDLRSTIRWGSWRRVTGAGVSAWLTSGRRAGVADDEHGRVVADKAPVAVLGGERDRAPRVARGLRGVPGSDHGGEADRDVGAPAPPLEGPGARGAVDGRPPRAVRLEAAEGGGPLACTTRSGLRSRSKRLNLPQEAVVLRGRWSPGADRTLVGCRRPGAPAGRSAGDGRHRGGALTGHVRPAGCSTLRAGGSGTPSADVNPPRYPRPAPATRPRRGVDRPLPSLCPFPVTCGLFRSAGW